MIYNERPVAQVLADDGIHLNSNAIFSTYDVENPNLPGKNPKHALLDLPEDPTELAQLKVTTSLIADEPLSARTDLWLSVQDIDKQTYQNRLDLIKQSINPAHLKVIARLPELNCTWVPLHSIHNDGYACTSYEAGITKLSKKELW